MPATLLVGIVVVSVLVNVGLLVRIARADHLTLRLPKPPRPAADAPGHEARSVSTPQRRRTLYVAASQSRPAIVAPPVEWTRPDARPMSETLPPELADMLSPAGIASPARPGEAGAFPIARSGRRWPDLVVRNLTPDELTGLQSAASWSRILENENARLLRYRRPVTIVMADVEGLARLAGPLGPEPVARLLPVVGGAFAREARASDWVAHLGEGRFAALLPETDEIQAINYVERVRALCEPWLVSAAVPLRLAIGWSSPSPSSDMEFAIRRAEERMHADRRIPGKPLAVPRVVPGAFVTLAAGHDGGPNRHAGEGGRAPEPAAEKPDAAASPGAAPQSHSKARRRQPAPPAQH